MNGQCGESAQVDSTLLRCKQCLEGGAGVRVSRRSLLNIARQRSALGLKSFVSRPERPENYDFHDF